MCYHNFKVLHHLIHDSLRMAKKKLPKEIKKKLEEWKFASGALIMCLVAYPDKKTVQSFQ